MKRSPFLLAAPALALLLAGCAGSASGDDGRPTVAASFYPFAFVAERVGGSFVRVENLTKPGAEPHDLELTPKQVAQVQEADVVVYEDGFQTAVDEAVDQADRSSGTVDVAKVVPLLEGSGEDEHAEEGHEHGDEHVDPHVWLDPERMEQIVEAVRASLVEAAPEHEAAIDANAKKLTAELGALDDEFAAGLKTCRTRTIVTSHAAFAYLADRYDLQQEPIAGIDPSNEPSPSQLAAITRLVREQGITTIFTEELVSPAIARTIADETGARTATLDPVEGLGEDTSDETYLSLMRRNLEALRTANSCQ